MGSPILDRDRHIVSRWDRLVAQAATRKALTFRAGTLWSDWTYAELDARSRELATRLRGAGVVPGAAVGVVARRVPETVAGLLAILRLGGCYVPVDPAVPPSRLDTLFASVGVAAVVSTRGCDIVLSSVAGTRERDLVVDRVDEQSPEDAAYIMFTSGSTGVPKGVLVPHRAVCRLVLDQDYLQFGPDRVFLQGAPMGFDASTLEIWGPLLNGGRCVLYPDDSLPTAAGLRDVIATTGVTTAWLTSSLFNAVVDHDPSCLGGLQELVIGGETLSVRHVRRALAAMPTTTIVNGYGPTENTTFTTCHRIPRDLGAVARIPIGTPLRGTSVAVVDAELRPVPAGTEGELVAMGEGLALGYAHDPERTRERFVELRAADGSCRRGYRTGDFVVELPGGVFDFRGRRDDQVKIQGYRIEPAEVEAVVAAAPEVRQCRVVAQRDAVGQLRLMAYVVMHDPASLASLQQRLLRQLPPYMVPHRVVALSELPLSANGKLAPPPAAPAAASPSARSPSVLARVFEAWCEVLGRAPDTADTGFFEAGGRSLDAIRLHDVLERRFATVLDPAFAFAFPTARRQAEQLSKGTSPTADAPVPPTSTAAPPFRS